MCLSVPPYRLPLTRLLILLIDKISNKPRRNRGIDGYTKHRRAHEPFQIRFPPPHPEKNAARTSCDRISRTLALAVRADQFPPSRNAPKRTHKNVRLNAARPERKARLRGHQRYGEALRCCKTLPPPKQAQRKENFPVSQATVGDTPAVRTPDIATPEPRP